MLNKLSFNIEICYSTLLTFFYFYVETYQTCDVFTQLKGIFFMRVTVIVTVIVTHPVSRSRVSKPRSLAVPSLTEQLRKERVIQEVTHFSVIQIRLTQERLADERPRKNTNFSKIVKNKNHHRSVIFLLFCQKNPAEFYAKNRSKLSL